MVRFVSEDVQDASKSFGKPPVASQPVREHGAASGTSGTEALDSGYTRSHENGRTVPVLSKQSRMHGIETPIWQHGGDDIIVCVLVVFVFVSFSMEFDWLMFDS